MPEARARVRRSITVVPRGVEVVLIWTFVMMSGVPLLVLFLVAGWFAFPVVREWYGLERWFPLIASPADVAWWLTGVLTLTVVVALLGGLYLRRKLIEPVLDISAGAAQLARGARHVTLPSETHELGELTGALNHLMGHIREDITELQQYGDRTASLNLAIREQVVHLASLLQIGELISNGTDLEAVLDVIVEKAAAITAGGFSFLCFQPLDELPLTLQRASGIEVRRLNSLAFDSMHTVIDAHHPPVGSMHAMWEALDRPNLLLWPVTLRHRCVGVIGVGNYVPNESWSQELVNLVLLFVKHISMAMETKLLSRMVKALSTQDDVTGVYNESYLRQRLAEEIKRAMLYQRPCALAVFRFQRFADFVQRHGAAEAERVLKRVAHLILECVSEVDRVGRLSDQELAVLLPERNKREAMQIVHEIEQRIATSFAAAPDPKDRLTVSGSVAENPLDGVTAEDLIRKASEVTVSTILASSARISG